MMHEIEIPASGQTLYGFLGLPAIEVQGVVIFAHGSGSSRHSKRNQYVAKILEQNGFATLLFDLLTEDEDRLYDNRFNIPLLATRLTYATYWTSKQNETKDLPIGYFGASTGAAAALISAAEVPDMIHAVVSRGGRPDLALMKLPEVKAPTLLIVGANDTQVIELNNVALMALTTEKELTIIPGATHLFEEPGTLEQAASAALDWFTTHLTAVAAH
jgi:putative phosphoribosyl transferase